ncbi:MAG: hypothetical protein QOC56_1295 [Alphaproteobacteria bacterium]|nr:hypothetical protein [Alphaproteobacteria bacterium]
MTLVRQTLCGTAALCLLALAHANARDNGQWGNQPPHVRQWFQKLMQPDNKYQSCCGEADAYQADSFEVEGDHYVAIITNGAGDLANGKPEIANGTRIPVPNHKMKWDDGNPTGHGIIFLHFHTKEVYCYVTPGGV